MPSVPQFFPGSLNRLHNATKEFITVVVQLQVKPTFSAQEMQRRLQMIRHHMEANAIDACVFTSYHNVHYFSDFLYCYFGRPYAFIVTANKAMSVSAGKNVLKTFWNCFESRTLKKFKFYEACMQCRMQGRNSAVCNCIIIAKDIK